MIFLPRKMFKIDMIALPAVGLVNINEAKDTKPRLAYWNSIRIKVSGTKNLDVASRSFWLITHIITTALMEAEQDSRNKTGICTITNNGDGTLT